MALASPVESNPPRPNAYSSTLTMPLKDKSMDTSRMFIRGPEYRAICLIRLRDKLSVERRVRLLESRLLSRLSSLRLDSRPLSELGSMAVRPASIRCKLSSFRVRLNTLAFK
ncbi:hypothetical protein BpHYR1_042140 [Brachionus plicatilis]|uniref:Uncharacterized protein n=1 Tax=Brachionus plicatilis TaxID=10195 RepID=A0A3M7R2D0_BRAPC|nr:hypothetical protein BpHYR1_042140 [Brachionus plicatilis]